MFVKDKVYTIHDKYPNNKLIVKVDITKKMFPPIMRSDLIHYVNAFREKSIDESYLWHLINGNLCFRL